MCINTVLYHEIPSPLSFLTMCRYVLLMLNKADEKEWESLRSAKFTTAASLSSLPLAERWILSQLHKVRDLVDLPVVTPLKFP